MNKKNILVIEEINKNIYDLYIYLKVTLYDFKNNKTVQHFKIIRYTNIFKLIRDYLKLEKENAIIHYCKVDSLIMSDNNFIEIRKV